MSYRFRPVSYAILWPPAIHTDDTFYSAAWPGLGKEALAELADVYVLLVQGSKSLQHLNVEAIIVLDHLGRTLPVPTIFCNSAQVGPSHHSSYCNTDI